MSGIQQSLLMYGAAGAYQVANSLRFRSSASAYLSRTPASAGNRQTWTWSGWVKRGTLGVDNYIFCARTSLGTSAGTTFTGFSFTSSDTFNLRNYIYGTGEDVTITTSQVFRDPSAWYHIVVATDTTQATATNRVKIYINGVQVTAFSASTYPSQNEQLAINYNFDHQQARQTDSAGSGSTYYDGYWADINFIDGQALSPTAFGQYSSTTGVWIPASYTGTYGTNGFHLNFSNGTSTTTLGYDSSGNSNNWTTNNISLTAGSTYDWMIDSPTSFAGSNYGVGNYAVLNPLSNGGGTLSAANLNITGPASIWGSRISSIAVTSGKWYFEGTPISGAATIGIHFGITQTPNPSSYLGFDANGYSYRSIDGSKWNNNSTAAYGSAYVDNDIIGIAFDADAGSVTFYKNNVSQGVAFSGLSAGTWYLGVSCYNGAIAVFNAGQRPFAYTPPSGYKSLCTYNLPTPSILAGNKYMDATTFNGVTGGGTVVNSGGMQPDLVWMKSRNVARNNELIDSVRGIADTLFSNLTNAEATDTRISSFNSNGFTYTANSNSANTGDTVIGWQWKANGTAVTNTAGSITSSVSANTTSGFAVVTYTGNGSSGATIGHGLGVAPSFMIVKSRSSVTNWYVYSKALPDATYYLALNAPDAQSNTAGNTLWNSTAPSSTIITLGTSISTNASATNYLIYCFAAIAGYSAFGSYTGNGSADGPFVYTGMRPRWILVKRTDFTSDWRIWDTSRTPYNAMSSVLYPNASDAEYTATTQDYDALSNGFKVRNSSAAMNASGSTYIYACFAENPFNYSLAR